MRKLCLVLLACASLRAQQSITLSAPSPPQTPVVSAVAAAPRGLGYYCYWVVATFPIGKGTPSAPACVSNVGTGSVTISWSPVSAATSYDVLRTNTASLPSGTASIAVATGVSGTSQTDSFGALSSYTLATAAPATATILLDNQNNGSPGLYQSINGGSETAIGSGGGASARFAMLFDGGGAVLSGTIVRCYPLQQSMTVKRWTASGDQTGSATVTLSYVAYSSYTGAVTSGNISTETITSAIKGQDTSLNVSLPAGSIVCGQISSESGFTWLSMELATQ